LEVCELIVASIDFSTVKASMRLILKYGIYAAGGLMVAFILYVLMSVDVFFSGRAESAMIMKLLSGSGNIAVDPVTALD